MYLQEWRESWSPSSSPLGSCHAKAEVSQKGCTPKVLPDDIQVIEEDEEPIGQGICEASKKDFLSEEKEKSTEI